MRDFPPVVPAFTTPSAPVRVAAHRRSAADRDGAFARPDTRSPRRYLLWTLRQQWTTLLVSSLVGVVEWLPGSVGPYLVGRIVDEGILARDLTVVGRLSLILAGIALAGVVAGVLRHTFIVRTWLVAMYGSMKLVTRKTTQMGHVLPQRVPTGEILSVSDGDSDQLGGLTEVLTRALGALIAYLLIAGIVLSMSVQLGLVVLVTAPLLVILAVPLLRPLERRQDVERTRLSELTSLATDIVAGLRILRGIGGERTFSANYDAQSQRTRRAGVSAGRWQGAVDAASVLFSGLFLVALTWLGARQVSAGVLSIGDLISLFGYAVFMVWPIQTFFELAQEWVRSIISARRTIAVMEQQPPWRVPECPRDLPFGAEIVDDGSYVAFGIRYERRGEARQAVGILWRSDDGSDWRRFGSIELGNCTEEGCPSAIGLHANEDGPFLLERVLTSSMGSGPPYRSADGSVWTPIPASEFGLVDSADVIITDALATPPGFYALLTGNDLPLSAWTSEDGATWSAAGSFDVVTDTSASLTLGSELVVARDSCAGDACGTSIWVGSEDGGFEQTAASFELVDTRVTFTGPAGYLLVGLDDGTPRASTSLDARTWTRGDPGPPSEQCGMGWLAGGPSLAIFIGELGCGDAWITHAVASD